MSAKHHRKTPDPFKDRMRRYGAGLSPASRKVAQFIDQNRPEAMTCSAYELAAAIGTSDATVIRTVQSLGFEGMQDLRRHLAGNAVAHGAIVTEMDRTLNASGPDALQAMYGFLDLACRGLETLRAPATKDALGKALQHLQTAERICVFGLGPTASLADYMFRRLRREGRKGLLLDQDGSALADQMLMLGQGDAGLMLAYGAPYREAEVVADRIRQGGGPLVLISDSEPMAKALAPDVWVFVLRGEPEGLACHSATLACLEMLLFGLARLNEKATIDSLKELTRLRGDLVKAGPRRSKRSLPGAEGKEKP